MFSGVFLCSVFDADSCVVWWWCTNVAAEAQQILVEGSAEWRVFHGIPDEGATHDAMEDKLGKEVFKVRHMKHQSTLRVMVYVCTHPCSHHWRYCCA